MTLFTFYFPFSSAWEIFWHAAAVEGRRSEYGVSINSMIVKVHLQHALQYKIKCGMQIFIITAYFGELCALRYMRSRLVTSFTSVKKEQWSFVRFLILFSIQ